MTYAYVFWGLRKGISPQYKEEGEESDRKKRWEDNIREWTGLEWNTILRKA